MTTCYPVLVTDADSRRAPRKGRALLPSEAHAILLAQEAVERTERNAREAVRTRNELFRKLRAQGVMAAEMGRAAATEEYPQGLHRTVVQRYLRGDK